MMLVGTLESDQGEDWRHLKIFLFNQPALVERQGLIQGRGQQEGQITCFFFLI